MKAANKLFEEIKEQYPEYIKQFYSTAANIFNENYIEPVEIGSLHTFFWFVTTS